MSAWRLTVVAFAVAVGALVVLPDSIGSVLARCPTPGRVGGAEPVVQQPGELMTLLPKEIPAIAPQAPQWVRPADLLGEAAAERNGFIGGFTQVHEVNDAHVDVSVYEFETELGARSFERSEFKRLCGFGKRIIDLPRTPGATGVIPRGGGMARVSFLRGRFAFVLHFARTANTSELRADLTAAVAALSQPPPEGQAPPDIEQHRLPPSPT